jgi:molybdenum cofactor synthesis domain-containing protein
VKAAVMIIGDEILSGRTQDINLNAIAVFLAGFGVDVAEARVVGDEKGEIIEALNALRTRYRYVFTTGGIGPTHDDITADCVAEAFGLALNEDPGVLAEMKAKWGGEVTPARRRMARVPEGGTLIRNPNGGPPGFQIGNVMVMAGVPSVMRGMLEDIGWRLEGGVVKLSRNVRVEGSGEGVIAEPLERVAKAHPELSLGSYPFFGPSGYGSNLVLRGEDAGELEAVVKELVAALRAAGIDNLTIDAAGPTSGGA